jgi:hypothetical protein
MPTDEYPGAPIKLEEARTEPTAKFATCGSERLDPGQDATAKKLQGDPPGGRVHPVAVPGGDGPF